MTADFSAALNAVRELVGDFAAHESRYLSPGYAEAEVRDDFIDKFFVALGWDVTHVLQKNPYEQEVKVERAVSDSASKRRADYAFFLAPNFRDPRFYVEAKKASRDIQNADDCFQAIRYGANSGTPLAVLTNFKQFRVLDCRCRPDIGTATGRCIADLSFHFRDFADEDKFARLYWLFSREAVAGESLAKYSAALPKGKGKMLQRGLIRSGAEIIGEEFLGELDAWRETLARAFKKSNPDLDGETLTEIVQRTLDRLVFLRFLEDKLIETHHRIAGFGTTGSVWSDFIAASRKLDAIYNGIVFKQHGLLDRPGFEMDEEAFQGICDALSHDQTPYDFNLIPIHILGSIYERFLGKVIVTSEKRAKVEDKPEVRKAGGVYYTPEYIVRYIVEQTVGKLIHGKTPKEIAELRFADIACGSGSFLLGVFDCLLRYHTTWYNEHSDELPSIGISKPSRRAKKNGNGVAPPVYRHADGKLHLTLAKKAEILVHNIYGVDLDQQATEVAQLSLYLKLLEDETPGSTRGHLDGFGGALLPTLSENIVCGNSLISTDILDSKLFGPAEEIKLHPMSWETKFPKVMKQGGFDAIVGNPPYLNVDDSWGKGDPRLAMLKTSFAEIYNDKTDLYYYFLCQAVRLSRGYVGYIVSRAFLQAYKADRLRAFLSDRTAVEEVVDFRNAKVFRGVGITTCVARFRVGGKKKTVQVYELLDEAEQTSPLAEQLANPQRFSAFKVSPKILTRGAWAFAPAGIAALNLKIDRVGVPLGKVLTVGQGMQTGCNEVFGERSRKEIARWGVPKKLYFKRATNTDIQRYQVRDRDEFLLYPNAVDSYDALPAGVKAYLTEHATALKGRAAYQRGDCSWWQYTWPLHAALYDRPRILCPYLATDNRFALDDKKIFLGLTDTSVLFQAEHRESLRYLLGLLNSRLLTFRFRTIGKMKGGGVIEYFWNSISKLSIRRISFDSKPEHELHDRMTKLVEQILDAKGKLSAAVSDKARNDYDSRCTDLDRRIDALVYELYGLTDDEIRIVESG